MSKLPDQFDFSKSGDQQRFENLSKEEKEGIITEAREEAQKLKEMIERGDASDYNDAENKIKESGELQGSEEEEYKFKVRITPRGDFYLNLGGGEVFMGNTLEGAIEVIGGETTLHVEKFERNLEEILQMIDSFVGEPKGNA